jgi:hypothetical protein
MPGFCAKPGRAAGRPLNPPATGTVKWSRTRATVADEITFIVTAGALSQASWSGAGYRIQRGPGRDPAWTRRATSQGCGQLHVADFTYGRCLWGSTAFSWAHAAAGINAA